MDLVGVAEIARFLGVSRQRVQQLSQTSDFPKPVARLSAGTIWERQDVVRWARAHDRLADDDL